MTDQFEKYLDMFNRLTPVEYIGERQTPPLYETLLLAKDNGLVGEERTVLTTALGMIQGGLLFIAGPSSAGKTQMVETAISLFDSDDIMYEVSTSTSDKALFYDAPTMNAARVHYYPDITEMPVAWENILKATAEGKKADHRVTDVILDDVTSKEILPPDCIIVAAASDNEKFDTDNFSELSTRMIKVEIDASADQTKLINIYQALAEAGLIDPNLSPERAAAVSEHLRNVSDKMDVFRQGEGHIGTAKFLNPATFAFAESEIIPPLFPAARRDFPRLMRFMRSVALYNWDDRMRVRHDGQQTLLVTPEDAWIAMSIMGQYLVRSSLNISDMDIEIISLLRGSNDRLSTSEIQQELRAAGLNVTGKSVRRSLRSMEDKGYVIKWESDAPITYQAAPFASYMDYDLNLNWSALVEYTKEFARLALEDADAEEYIARYCEGNGLLTVHPITGEIVNITEASPFDDEEIHAAANEFADELAQPLGFAKQEEESAENGADSSPAEAEPAPDDEAQGTLV
jgi:hypothetical protein